MRILYSLFIIFTLSLLFFTNDVSAKKKTLTAEDVEKIVDTKLAQESKKQSWIEKHKIKPILKTYINYSIDLKNSANQRKTATKWDNTFNISRFYFGIKGDIIKHIGFEFKTDINAKITSGDPDDSFDIFLKTGWISFKDFDWAPGLTFVIGQNSLPWVGYVEKIYGYRMHGQVLSDYERYLTSTDLGVSIKYKFPEKWGDLHFSVVNGTGYNNGPEVDNYKDLHLRVTIKPLNNKNFFLSGLGVVGFLGSASTRRYRAGALLGWKDNDYGTLAGEIFFTQDPNAAIIGRQPSVTAANPKGLGGSVFGELKFFWWGDVGKHFSVVGRIDYWDPDLSVGNNWHYHAISGLAYTVNKHFKVFVNYDWSHYTTGALQQGNSTAFLDFEAKL